MVVTYTYMLVYLSNLVNSFLLTNVTFYAIVTLKGGDNLNERIKQIRKAKGLSQEEFGKHLMITKASVSRIESGLNNPSEQTIKLICNEFNVNKDWLLTGAGGEENMFIPDDMKYFFNVGKLSSEQNEFKKFYLNMMMNLPDDYWNYIYNEFKKFENDNKNSGE